MALRQVAARRRRIERGRKQARRDEMTEVSRRQIRAVQSMTPMGAFREIATEHAPDRMTPTSNRAVDDLALLPDDWGEDPDQEPLVPMTMAGKIKVRLGPRTKLTPADPSDSWGEDPDLDAIRRDEAVLRLGVKG